MKVLKKEINDAVVSYKNINNKLRSIEGIDEEGKNKVKVVLKSMKDMLNHLEFSYRIAKSSSDEKSILEAKSDIDRIIRLFNDSEARIDEFLSSISPT